MTAVARIGELFGRLNRGEEEINVCLNTPDKGEKRSKEVTAKTTGNGAYHQTVSNWQENKETY